MEFCGAQKRFVARAVRLMFDSYFGLTLFSISGGNCKTRFKFQLAVLSASGI